MTTDQPESINDRLDRLENLLGDTADLVLAHDEVLVRIENSLQQLTTNVNQLTTRVTTNNDRIEQILEYLFRERPNGRQS